MPSHLNTIKSNIQNFSKGDDILEKVNPVFAPRQKDIIRIIDSYWQSRYDRHDFDEQGQKKPFFNVIETPVFTSAKQIDLDTKDVRIIPVDGQPIAPANFFQKELNLWMRDTGISKLFNQIKWRLPKYGTVVLKHFKTEDGQVNLKFVPLQNLHLDVRAESIEKSHFIAEEHDFLPRNLKKMPWDQKKIDEAIMEFKDKKERGERTIRVWEYFGNIPGETDNFFVIAEIDNKKGIILDQDTLSSPPYHELHWDNVPGRWLGAGVVEKNLEAQIHMNRVAYLKANGLHWTSKHIYQTRDSHIDENLMVDVEDGQVLHVRSPIEPIVNEERNLAAYREEEQQWMQNINRRTFTTDIIRGQRPPAGTPLGSAVLASQNAGTFFEQKREEFGEFMKDLMWKFVIPEFKEKNRAEHWLNFVGASEDNMRQFDRMASQERVTSRILSYTANNGEFPMPSQIRLMKATEQERLKQTDERYVKIPEGFYDNLKFKMELVLTGESQDLQGKLNALQIAIQSATNPEERRRLRNKLLNLIGEEPVPQQQVGDPADAANMRVRETGGSQPRIRMPNQTPGRAQDNQTI